MPSASQLQPMAETPPSTPGGLQLIPEATPPPGSMAAAMLRTHGVFSPSPDSPLSSPVIRMHEMKAANASKEYSRAVSSQRARRPMTTIRSSALLRSGPQEAMAQLAPTVFSPRTPVVTASNYRRVVPATPVSGRGSSSERVRSAELAAEIANDKLVRLSKPGVAALVAGVTGASPLEVRAEIVELAKRIGGTSSPYYDPSTANVISTGDGDAKFKGPTVRRTLLAASFSCSHIYLHG